MTNDIKRIVHEVLDELVQRDPNGERWSKELYLDYRDRELDEDMIKTIADSDGPRGYFDEMTDNVFMDYKASVEGDLIKEVAKALDAANMEYDEDEIREYIYDRVDIIVPTDEILKNNNVCVNIIVDTGDANYEFTKNSFAHGYYGGEGIEDESSLLWLAKQQGATADDLRRAFNEGTAFDANTLKILQARDDALKILESFGKKDAFGYEINVGKYALAKRIESDLRDCERKMAVQTRTLADLPQTYEAYMAACDARGISLRFSSADSFIQKRDEIISNAENRIQELSTKIAELKNKVKVNQLEPVFEAEKQYKEACGKVVEVAYTEEYKKCHMLDSLIECSASTTSGMNALTFLVQMPLSDYLDLREAMSREEHLNKSVSPEDRKGTGEIVLSKSTHAILYDDWAGAGSCSDIELCTDVRLPINLIHSANPDGMNGNGVMEIYGVNSSFYHDTLIGIAPMPEKDIEKLADKNTGLDKKIASAEAIKNATMKSDEHSFDHIEKEV
ncbi:MAG: hypothetical protein IJZ42_13435 [Lachnospiraceae bacterium]|nr:hypothetical protein [Lachnospiraceae bacterium]